MFTRFTSHVSQIVWRIKTVILVLLTLVVAGGAAIALAEKMPFADTLYFAFVTGLTIGYGDIVPLTLFGRFVAILIGIVGIFFTGLMVAESVVAVRRSFEEMRNGG
jgi:hypothetical protein